MYFVVAGNCRAIVDEKNHLLETGDFCWVTPGVEFRFYPGASSKPPGLFRFRMSVSRGRTTLRPDWKMRIVRNASETIEHARSLLALQSLSGRFSARRIACSAVLFSISAFEESRRAPDGNGLPAAIRQLIKRHVLEHPEERISPAALARLVGLSPDYFTRMFRLTFDVAPRTWLLKQRLHHAAGLLCEPGWRISEVAARMGYPDLYLFSRQFKKEFGSSPRAWKRIHKIDAGGSYS